MSATPSVPQFTLADFSYELPAELVQKLGNEQGSSAAAAH